VKVLVACLVMEQARNLGLHRAVDPQVVGVDSEVVVEAGHMSKPLELLCLEHLSDLRA